MNSKYNFIEHTADIAVELEGDNFEELVYAAFSAWKESVIESLSHGKNKIIVLEESESTQEELLVQIISEINYYLLSKKLIASEIEILSYKEKNELLKIKLKVFVENYDSSKHILKVEIKAVTFHQMEIKKVKGKLKTRLIFDI